jgi:general secretion pathway protein A
MFLSFYGLRENPFGTVADGRLMYPSRTHRNALDTLRGGLEQGQELLLLVAEPGLGKTTVLRRLATQLGQRIVFFSLTGSGGHELQRLLLASLGIDSTGRDLPWIHERLSEKLRGEARAGHRFVLILDDAHNLEDSSFETLRILSGFECSGHKLVQTVLAGQYPLAHALLRRENEQLRQRLSVMTRVVPLSPAEVGEYIDCRLRLAGYDKERLFTSPACELAARWSGGIPRKINSLCFNTLTIGCADEKRQINTAIIREAIRKLDLDATAPSIEGEHRARSLSRLGGTRAVAVAAGLAALALVVLFSYRSVKGRAAAANRAHGESLARSSAPSVSPKLADASEKASGFVELPRVVPTPDAVAAALPLLAAPKEAAPEPAPTPDRDGRGLTQSDGPPLDDAGLEAPVSDDASEAPPDPSFLAGESR